MLLSSQDPPMNKTNKNQKQEKSSAEAKTTSVQAQTGNKDKLKTSEQTQKSSVPPKDTQTAKAGVEQKQDKKVENKTAAEQSTVQESSKNIDKTTNPSAKETSEKSAVQKDTQTVDKKIPSKTSAVCLQALFAYKKGMTHIYDNKNQYTPVTALQYKPCRVTQIKTKEREGYNAVQVALESSKKGNKALQNHLKQAGFKNGACFVREVRQTLPDNIQVGQEVSIESLKEGDVIRLSSVSKGHGFSGVVKRWGFGGGPASHGAEKHRTTGSIANTATQGRVFPGKKMPGHFGCDRTTVSNVKVIKVAEDFIFVKGPVPGAFQSLVELRK